MRGIFVRHDSCGTFYLFRVPETVTESIRAGTRVLVKTKNGEKSAVAICDEFLLTENTDEWNAVMEACRAVPPLAPVTAVYHITRYPEEPDPITQNLKEDET